MDESKLKSKRLLNETSPEMGPGMDSKKKKNTDFDMDTMLAKFEVMLDQKLDDKLKNVATKADIEEFQNEIKVLKHQNEEMRNEIKVLQESEKVLRDRLEHIEKHQRRNNILVTGLNGNNIDEIRETFREICEKVLKVDIKMGSISKINKPGFTNKCVIELASPVEVGLVLKNGKLLRNTKVFVQKDLTKQERNRNYFLRRIKKVVQIQDGNCKVVGTTLFAGGKKYKWSDAGHITAENEADSNLLKDMLLRAGAEDQFNVIPIAKTHHSTQTGKVSADSAILQSTL